MVNGKRWDRLHHPEKINKANRLSTGVEGTVGNPHVRKNSVQRFSLMTSLEGEGDP